MNVIIRGLADTEGHFMWKVTCHEGDRSLVIHLGPKYEDASAVAEKLQHMTMSEYETELTTETWYYA